MQRDLIGILACPMCQSSLEMSVTEERQVEIIKGSLFCTVCDVYYPIDDGTPNLLLPQDKVTQV